MIKVHTKSGQTLRLDLRDESQAREWVERLARSDFQRDVSGVTIVSHHDAAARCSECGARGAGSLGVQYSLARPDSFDQVSFHVEGVEQSGRVRGGERLIVFADDIRVTAMAHAAQPAVRVSVSKMGRRRYNPYAR